MRKDKAVYRGKDIKTGEPKRPWTDKYKCFKCGRWNLVSNTRCWYCGFREEAIVA
jgi:hypothetical protein